MICTQCNKSFSNIANYNRHVESHKRFNVEEIRNFINKGYSGTEIAKKYNCSRSTITGICIKNGIKLFKTKNEILSYFLKIKLSLEIFKNIQEKTDIEILNWYNEQVDDHLKLNNAESIRSLRKKYNLTNIVKIKKEKINSLTKEKLEELYKTKTLLEISKLYGLAESTVSDLKNKFNIPSKHYNDSTAQKEITSILKNYGFNIIENAKIFSDGRQLDIYIPEYKFAIEYCGVYHHNNLFKPKDYHRKKYEDCLKLGIRLVTIFSDEWTFKKNICLSNIFRILNKNKVVQIENGIEITKNIAKEFLNKNHLNDFINTKKYYGFYCENELVLVLASNNDKIKRICYKQNINVIGDIFKGFSKIYCDLRWEYYDFNKIKEIRYRRYYIKNGKRFNKKLAGCNFIYDCGHVTYIINYPTYEI